MTLIGWPMRFVLLMAVLQAPLCFSVEAKLIWLPGPFDINAIKKHSGEEHVDRYVADSQTNSLYLVYRHGALDAKGRSVISFTIQGFRKNNEIEESLSFSQRILAGSGFVPQSKTDTWAIAHGSIAVDTSELEPDEYGIYVSVLDEVSKQVSTLKTVLTIK